MWRRSMGWGRCRRSWLGRKERKLRGLWEPIRSSSRKRLSNFLNRESMYDSNLLAIQTNLCMYVCMNLCFQGKIKIKTRVYAYKACDDDDVVKFKLISCMYVSSPRWCLFQLYVVYYIWKFCPTLLFCVFCFSI